ncbi:MAG TPA: hypothetical protein V6C85_07865 [Allocoleopsis sp.]
MNKKLIGLALVLTLASTLGACNSGGGDKTPASGGSPESPTTSPS